ncbi:hypothetical protein [Microvirgula aerodenitrificans]|uniref:hypothetical protein n=1 Tax=Microvirgula aerodenitrificans TaxID=57480 RepID=UPI0028EA97FB|nr:hypothetical protein [Microvirgula aerodenitrificans]
MRKHLFPALIPLLACGLTQAAGLPRQPAEAGLIALANGEIHTVLFTGIESDSPGCRQNGRLAMVRGATFDFVPQKQPDTLGCWYRNAAGRIVLRYGHLPDGSQGSYETDSAGLIPVLHDVASGRVYRVPR